MRIVLSLLLLAGCAAAGSRSAANEAAFERELAGRTAGEPRQCVSIVPQQGLTIENRRTVVQRRGDTIWVNRLSRDCPGLDPFATLVVEANGSQYCRGDRVRALSAGSSIPGPYCILGDFIPYRRAR
jgi:hypothetical protein